MAALLGLLLVVLAYQAVRTALALRDARALTTTLRAQLADADLAAADGTVETLVDRADTAYSHSDNVLWDAVAAIPWLGDDVDAVQTLASALHRSTAVLPQTVEVARELQESGLRTADGGLDVPRIQALEQPVRRMAAALTAADREVRSIDRTHLPPVQDATESARTQLDTLASSARGGASALEVLPPLLGSEGKRRYVLLVQNTAEARASGGLLGPLSMIDVRDGKVSLGQQRDFLSFAPDQAPVAPISAEERAIYGASVLSDLRDMTATPDFPAVAQRVSGLLDRELGDRVDGVLSVDPIALARLLEVTGPVQVRGQQLRGDNAVRVLLSETYSRFEKNVDQNAFFADAARAIFDKLVTRPVSPSMLTTVAEGVRQGRVMLWSAQRTEQARIEAQPVSGALPGDAGGHPQVGMYLNDGTTGKLEYYLDYQAALSTRSCADDGTQRLRAEMVLRSSVPPGGRGLARNVLALPGFAPPGVMRLQLAVYGPEGGKILRLEANGTEVPLVRREHAGRPVTVATLLLAPGQEIVLRADLDGAAGDRGDPRMEWTPGIRWAPTTSEPRSACG